MSGVPEELNKLLSDLKESREMQSKAYDMLLAAQREIHDISNKTLEAFRLLDMSNERREEIESKLIYFQKELAGGEITMLHKNHPDLRPKTAEETRELIEDSKQRLPDSESAQSFLEIVEKKGIPISVASASSLDVSKKDNILEWEKKYLEEMKYIYSLRSNDDLLVENGQYPGINCILGCDPEIVNRIFDAGCLQSLYLIGSLKEIEKLPTDIINAVKEFFNNNPLVEKNNFEICLRILSAAAEWDNENYYPPMHVIQCCMLKDVHHTYEPKPPLEYDEKMFSTQGRAYRRAMGLQAIYDKLEKLKTGNKCWIHYHSKTTFVVSSARASLRTAGKIFNTAMRDIYMGKKCSEAAQRILCKRMKHMPNSCPACDIKKKRTTSPFSEGRNWKLRRVQGTPDY